MLSVIRSFFIVFANLALFFSGNFMWLKQRWGLGYGAFSSPPIFKESDYCSLEFYYRFLEGWHGQKSLSVFIEEVNGNRTTLLWFTSESTSYWKKKVIKLPQTSYNYSVVFLGYFKGGTVVLVDDMEFIRCNLCKSVHFSFEGLGPRYSA